MEWANESEWAWITEKTGDGERKRIKINGNTIWLYVVGTLVFLAFGYWRSTFPSSFRYQAVVLSFRFLLVRLFHCSFMNFARASSQKVVEHTMFAQYYVNGFCEFVCVFVWMRGISICYRYSATVAPEFYLSNWTVPFSSILTSTLIPVGCFPCIFMLEIIGLHCQYATPTDRPTTRLYAFRELVFFVCAQLYTAQTATRTHRQSSSSHRKFMQRRTNKSPWTWWQRCASEK